MNAFSIRGLREGGQKPIAIYHLSIKIVSRGTGRSAVAAAAYRAGAEITNEYDGITHDYTRKGGVAHTEILLPERAPAEYVDRAALWNAVEQAEKYKNAQLAREIEVALPVELSAEQNLALVREYCQKHFVSAGMCADICIHDKGDGNPHAHIMLTMRPFEKGGHWGAKQKKEYALDKDGERIYDPKKRQYKCKSVPTTDWNEQTKAEEWRAGWTAMVNAALERQGMAERVDHRSYERQGIPQIPTVHLGPDVSQMEKRGIRTRRGDINRQVHLDNRVLRQLRARIHKLKGWLAKENTDTEISLTDTLTAMLNHSTHDSRYRKVANLKTAAKAIGFLQTNGIHDMVGLKEKVANTHQQLSGLSGTLKKTECRLKTLDSHILHAENYLQHRNVYRKYKQQKSGKRDAFMDQHRAEIMLYETAAAYLRGVMNGRKNIPLKAWKVEALALAAEKEALYQDYTHMKEDVREVEYIRKTVEQAMRDTPSEEKERPTDMRR